MKRLFVVGIFLVPFLFPSYALGLTFQEYWSLSAERRVGYMLGVVDTVYNEANNGIAYSDCVLNSIRNRSFVNALAKMPEEQPAFLALPAPLVMRTILHDLCKAHAEPPPKG